MIEMPEIVIHPVPALPEAFQEFCIVPMSWVAEVTEALNRLEPYVPTLEEQMQASADYNRDHAEEKFGDQLFARDGHWFERGSGEPVVFTPHGWRKEKEVHDELSS